MTLTRFVETTQYDRFKEFCDTCITYCHIGLCYGAPGVGKTRSARIYANYDLPIDLTPGQLIEDPVRHAVFYTVPVQNSPSMVDRQIAQERQHNRVSMPSYQVIDSELSARITEARETKRKQLEEYEHARDYTAYKDFAWSRPNEFDLMEEKQKRLQDLSDPTRLIIVDESDRLRVSSLEQIRDIYDRDAKIGVILIGMPGLEKRLARYPQLYSRVGFVHEFRPLRQNEARDLVRSLLESEECIDDDGIVAILRSSGGNFRLIERLLAQVRRVLKLNDLTTISAEVVSAARESLVIGTD